MDVEVGWLMALSGPYKELGPSLFLVDHLYLSSRQ